MPQSSVSSSQRFTKKNPCPICSGYDRMPRGKGERCWGFLGSDGTYAHCMRPEYAHGLPEEAGGSYAHRLTGSCKCGRVHGDMPASPTPTKVHARSKPKGEAIATYDYHDERGEVVGQVVRYEPKDFSQRRLRPDGRWEDKEPERKVPFHLPQLIASDIHQWIFIVEGEEDVLALERIGLVATCNLGGSSRVVGPYVEFFRDRKVAIIPDDDEKGHKHAKKWELALMPVAEKLQIVTLPNLQNRNGFNDPRDWVNARGSKDLLLYEVDRVTELQELQVSRQTARAAAVLDDIETFLSGYLIYPSEHTRVAHVLWILHAWFMDAWYITPRIAFLSPEPGSGKSRGLALTSLLTPNPNFGVDLSTSWLFRTINDDENGRPTILMDEVDAVFTGKETDAQDKRSLLNSGYEKIGWVGRTNPNTLQPEKFLVYSAVGLAGLGALPETLASRSIIIRMQRRAANETLRDFRYRTYTAEGTVLRQKITDIRQPLYKQIERHLPIIPPGLRDRNADIWEPLLTVADVVGGEWPRRAREAAVAIVENERGEETSLNMRLLRDIRTIFESWPTRTQRQILDALTELEDAPWQEVNRGKEMTPYQLGRRLARYGIHSDVLNTGGARRVRGYKRETLEPTWLRYLGSIHPDAEETGTEEASPPPPESCNSVTSVTSAQPGQKISEPNVTVTDDLLLYRPNGVDPDPRPW